MTEFLIYCVIIFICLHNLGEISELGFFPWKYAGLEFCVVIVKARSPCKNSVHLG